MPACQVWGFLFYSGQAPYKAIREFVAKTRATNSRISSAQADDTEI